MPLPLYQGLHAPQRPDHSHMHMGLWFERYFDGYTQDFGEVSKDGRSDWIKALRAPQLGNKADLQAKQARLQALVQAQGGQTRVYHCPGNFVTGLGNPHPIENGFLWHPTQPGDWHSPVPVSYLVARNLKLQFAIAPRPGVISADMLEQEMANVWLALDKALQWLGAGAKTAIGFGQFKEDSADRLERQEAEKQAAQAARTAGMSEAQKRIDAYISTMRDVLDKYPNRKKDRANTELHNQARALVKEATEAADWSAEDKKAAALAVEEWLPKLVEIDIKDERRKLKLSALKGM